MIGLVLATRREARPLLDRLSAERVADATPETYRFGAGDGRGGGVIVVSGIGKRAAREATEHILADCGTRVVVNVGICGALRDGLEGGTLLRVDTVVDGDEVLAGDDAEPLACEASAWRELPAARLASVDEPVFEDDRRSRLAAEADVVDMEASAVAEVCRQRSVRLHVIKGVTDLANHTGKQDILKNIDGVSADLAKAVVAGLGRLSAAGDASTLSNVLRLAKIEHSLLSLPLLLAGAWLGAGGAWPSLATLALIALAGVGARTLGMAMNRILDRDLDAANERTAGRELPSGRMSVRAAYGVAAGGLAAYLLACAGLGPICLALAPAPAVPLCAYSLLKRFTSLCHFGIGLCLSLAPLCAFVAASGHLAFGQEVLLLAAFTFCWISGFDIIYALQDEASDRRTGVRSIPAALGGRRAQIIAAAVHAVALAAIVWLWWLVGGGALSGAALAVAAAGLAFAYHPRVPLPVRFFPTSAVVGVAGALVPLLGEIR